MSAEMQLVSFPIAETESRRRVTFMRGEAGEVEAHWFDLIDRDDVDMFYVEMMEADATPVVYIDGLPPEPPPVWTPCGYCARCGYGGTGDGSDACLHKQYR